MKPQAVDTRVGRGLDGLQPTTAGRLLLETGRACRRQRGGRWMGLTRLASFALTLSALAGALALLPQVLGPTVVGAWLPGRLHALGALYWPVAMAVTIVLLTTVFHLATRRARRWRRELPGAVLAGSMWVLVTIVVQGGFGWSLDGVAMSGLLALAVLVVWVSAAAVAVLVGAGFNAATRVLWPPVCPTSPRTHLVEWERSQLVPRSSVWDEAVDDLSSGVRPDVHDAWPALDTDLPHRRAS